MFEKSGLYNCVGDPKSSIAVFFCGIFTFDENR